ncbi:hypothetical protein TRVL_06316 [Trypanosoma vivax]|nr:hypothetical protein TRVL_06316 [Trypanosoma vivax]
MLAKLLAGVMLHLRGWHPAEREASGARRQTSSEDTCGSRSRERLPSIVHMVTHFSKQYFNQAQARIYGTAPLDCNGDVRVSTSVRMSSIFPLYFSILAVHKHPLNAYSNA